MRSANSSEGIGDRLRAVAFAELQARDGFLWGCQQFPEVVPELRRHWMEFAAMEELHAQLLLDRIADLELDIAERSVTDNLMRMFLRSDNADLFLYQISTAEERGMEVGLSMIAPMRAIDPISAAIFERIANDEVDHVKTAQRYMQHLDIAYLRERAQALSRVQA